MPREPHPLYAAARKKYEDMVAEVQPYLRGDYKYIGKDMPRFDALPKARGEAKYTRDMLLPGMLYAKFLASPYAHARIISIDTSKAEKLPRVKAILTYQSEETISGIPVPIKNIKTFQGLPFLAQEANWEGEFVGAVVCAESPEICDEALKLIDVQWEELPFAVSVEDAKKDPTRKKLETGWKRNLIISDFPNYKEDDQYDVERGFKEADVVVEGSCRLHQFFHAGAEPDSALAKWEGDEVTVWIRSVTQHAAVTSSAASYTRIAAALGIPASKINLIFLYQGGSFGQNHLLSTQAARLVYAAILLAKKTGKPVKAIMSRRDYYYGGEAEGVYNFKIGVKKDGTITAVKGEFLIGQGAPGGSGTLWAAADHVANWVRYDLKCPYESHYLSYETNTVPKWWTRSEQNQNARFLQAVIEYAAEAIKTDPAEVYLKNARNPEPSARAVIEEAKKRIGWDEKWHPPGTKILPNGKYHGIGFYFGHSWGNYTPPYINAALRVTPDGAVTIIGCKPDSGVSAQTAYAQIVADEMGVRFEDIHFSPISETKCGYALQLDGGAASNHGNSWLMAKLAIKAKKKVLELAAPKLGVKPEDLDMKDSVIFVKADPSKKIMLKDLATTFTVEADVGGYDWSEENVYGIFTPFHCYQAVFAEVEVDPDTGQVDLMRMVTAYDIGKTLRRASALGQIYGQACMAIWRAIQQSDLIHDPLTGVRLNADLLNTHVSTCLDCENINLEDIALMEVGHSDGAYGNTGVGEMNIAQVCALISAVHNAIGKWVDPPITPDKVLKALGKA
jgi:xanthine dehydrogenase molybdenum-binding subunit